MIIELPYTSYRWYLSVSFYWFCLTDIIPPRLFLVWQDIRAGILVRSSYSQWEPNTADASKQDVAFLGQVLEPLVYPMLKVE